MQRRVCFKTVEVLRSFHSTGTERAAIVSATNALRLVPAPTPEVANTPRLHHTFLQERRWSHPFATSATRKDHPDVAIDEEHVHVGNEVDKLLVQGRKDGGVKGILKVVIDHGTTFSPDNYVTTLQQLVKVGAGDKIVDDSNWGNLRSLIDKAMPHMSGRQLAGVLAGLAQLGLASRGDSVFKTAAQELSKKLSGLDPQQLVDTVKELRNVDLPGGGADIFGKVRERATEISHKFSDELKQDLEWAEDTFGLKGKK